MKIVFFGTPEYVLPIVKMLDKSFRIRKTESPITAIITQSPKPTGRKKIVEYSPVDNWAHKHDIPVYYDLSEFVKDAPKADVAVLAAYGAILPEEILTYFPHGIVNVHPSLLPEFRGPSPIQGVIATNSACGVTIMKLDKFMDHGEIINQFTDEILADDTLESLRSRLFVRSAEVLETLLPAYVAGKINLKTQDHTKATYTSLIRKEHGFVPWEVLQSAMQGKPFEHNIGFIYKRSPDGTKIPFQILTTSLQLLSLMKSLTPWPGIWTHIEMGKEKEEMRTLRLKILSAHVESIVPSSSYLVLDQVQLEGKNPVSWDQFREAYKIGF